MIPHIELLPLHKLLRVLSHLDEYNISQKIDGSQLLFGIDEHGFYTSRETKGGTRIYNVDDYPIKFSTTYMRAAHVALQHILPVLTMAGLAIGDQVESEVLYGELPNAVPYLPDINRVVFLRSTAGNIDIDVLHKVCNDITAIVKLVAPVTYNAQDIATAPEETKWVFSKNPDIEPVDDLSSILLPYVSLLGEFKGSKSAATSLINDIKGVLLCKLVHGTDSVFGPTSANGGWIEGVVLRHKVTGEQVKIVDNEIFGTIRNFLWNTRNSLSKISYHVNGTHSFVGRLLIDLGSTISHPELGTLRAKRYLTKLAKDNNTILSVLSATASFTELQGQWLGIVSSKEKQLLYEYIAYKENKHLFRINVEIGDFAQTFFYNSAVDIRTKQVFADTFALLARMKSGIQNSTNLHELMMVLVGRHLT